MCKNTKRVHLLWHPSTRTHLHVLLPTHIRIHQHTRRHAAWRVHLRITSKHRCAYSR